MRVSIQVVLNNPRTMEWIKNRTKSEDPILYSSTGGKDLANILDKKPKNKPIAVLVPNSTNSRWWQELIGAVNNNVYFLPGKPEGASAGLAVVVFNTTQTLVALDEFHYWDAPSWISKLNELGINDTKLAEYTKAPNLMTIHRAKRQNSVFNKRMKLISTLADFYQRNIN